jgi:MFS family permease
LRLKDESTPSGSGGRGGHVVNTTDIKASTTKTNGSSSINWHCITAALLDIKSWLTALMFFSVNVSFASLPVFLPTIINAMAFSPLASQALAAPPYLCAFAFVLAVGYWSDRIPNSRGWFLMSVAGMSCCAYFGIAVTGSLAGSREEDLAVGVGVWVRYILLFPAAMGLFASVVLILTWTWNNHETSEGKGAGMVLLNLVGQCGPLLGVRVFDKVDAPGYVKGMAVCSGFMGGVVVLAGMLRWWLRRCNERRWREGSARGRSVEMREVGGEDKEREWGGDGEEAEVEERLIGGEEQDRGGGRREVFRFML